MDILTKNPEVWKKTIFILTYDENDGYFDHAPSFVAADPKRPVVCFDETPRQLIGEERIPIRAEPGKSARYDYEYVRNGTANVFMAKSRVMFKLKDLLPEKTCVCGFGASP